MCNQFYLVFYPVDNEKGYGRDTFDNIDDNDVKRKMLEEISDVRYYNIDTLDDIQELIEDYNDALLDGGWWMTKLEQRNE